MPIDRAPNEREARDAAEQSDSGGIKGVGGAVAGVASGTVAGLVVGGPPGAVVGAVVGAVAGEGFGYALETMLDSQEATAGVMQEEEEARREGQGR